MKSHWISHKGKQIFCYDLSNLRSDVAAIKTEVQAAETVAFKQPKSSLLHLVDVRDTVVSIDAARIFKAAATDIRPYVHKGAIIGVKGVVKIVAQAVNKAGGYDTVIFDDIGQALDWLVTEKPAEPPA